MRASTKNTWAPLPKPLIVDSGAGETVMPVDWLTMHPLTESDGSRANDFYTTADGSKVFYEGQKNIGCLHTSRPTAMIHDFSSCQSATGSGISKSNGEETGTSLFFDQDSRGKDTSYIQNKRTNEKIWLRQETVCTCWTLWWHSRKGTMIEVRIRIFTGRDSVCDTCKPD